jgi:uncharacterized paraquat-inducible protein A
MNQKICIHCKTLFNLEPDLSAEEAKYCGYCRAVILGGPDAGWIPAARCEDLPPGFHEA